MNLNELFKDIRVIKNDNDGNSQTIQMGSLEELVEFLDNETENKATSKVGIPKEQYVAPSDLQQKLDSLLNSLIEKSNELKEKRVVDDILKKGMDDYVQKLKDKYKFKNEPENEGIEIMSGNIEDVLNDTLKKLNEKFGKGNQEESIMMNTDPNVKFTRDVTDPSTIHLELDKDLKPIQNGTRETMGAIYYLTHYVFSNPKKFRVDNVLEYTEKKYKIIQRLLNQSVDINNDVWNFFDISYEILNNGSVQYSYTDWESSCDCDSQVIDFQSDTFVEWINNAYDVKYYIKEFLGSKSINNDKNIFELEVMLDINSEYPILSKEQKSKINKDIRRLRKQNEELEDLLEKYVYSWKGGEWKGM